MFKGICVCSMLFFLLLEFCLFVNSGYHIFPGIVTLVIALLTIDIMRRKFSDE